MTRKNESPQKAAMREMMRDYLKNNDISIKSGTDVNSVMRDMMSVLLESTLDEELDEELGYSKYDYRNKETDNSRNGHSKKTMHTSYGDMNVAIPRDRNGDYEPQLIKKYQNTVTQDMEENHGQDPPHRKRMAGTPPGRSLCRGVHGCHPLPCAQRRAYCKTCRLHCARH